MSDTQAQTHHEQLDNGIELLAEVLPDCPIAAVNVRVGLGARHEAADRLGLAHVVAETLLKGAGEMDARALLDAFDLYGLTRGSRCDVEATDVGCGCLPRHVGRAIELLSQVVRRPRLAPDQVELAKTLSLEEIKTLEDEPGEKVSHLLWRKYLGGPLGRATLGEPETVKAIRPDDAVAFWGEGCGPGAVQIVMAGGVDWPAAREAAVRAFGDWRDGAKPQAAAGTEDATGSSGLFHERNDSEQTHIAVAFPSVPREHPQYFAARMAMAVLSAGASSRLFTEVREKRGLVYAVFASWTPLRGRGNVYLYAGTTAERADETLRVCLDELGRLGATVTQDEVERARRVLKGRLLTTAELSGARVRAIADEFFLTGKVTPVAEIIAGLEAVDADGVRDYLAEFPPEPLTAIALGPRPLKRPEGIELSAAVGDS